LAAGAGERVRQIGDGEEMKDPEDSQMRLVDERKQRLVDFSVNRSGCFVLQLRDPICRLPSGSIL
jgi:hypothetical protein